MLESCKCDGSSGRGLDWSLPSSLPSSLPRFWQDSGGSLQAVSSLVQSSPCPHQTREAGPRSHWTGPVWRVSPAENLPAENFPGQQTRPQARSRPPIGQPQTDALTPLWKTKNHISQLGKKLPQKRSKFLNNLYTTHSHETVPLINHPVSPQNYEKFRQPSAFKAFFFFFLHIPS